MNLSKLFRRRNTTPDAAAAPQERLRGLLQPGHVALDLDVRHGSEVLDCAARLLTEGDGAQAHRVRASLAAREKLGSTALGHGCAVPHARVDALEHPAAAFVRTSAPLPFEAPDGRGVDLFFVLLVPEDADEAHLAMLAAVAERFADRRFREALRACRTPWEAVALLER